MCSCICLIVKTHIVCITDYLLCLQVHLIYIRTYSIMYCVYVRTCVCVLQFRVHTYVHNARALDCLFVRSVTWLWVLRDAVCAIQFRCTYFVCRCHFHLPAGYPVWGNGSMTPEQPRCLRRHGGSHDCSTSGIERLWGLLWSACLYVRTYIPTSTPIFCLLAFWVAQRHTGVLSLYPHLPTYVHVCI